MATVSVFTNHYNSKILVPQRRDEIVQRQRLIDLLHEYIHLRVHVVEAPAGYGKTTLLADFANEIDTPVCWYSTDISDRDPTLLLEGILTSIRYQFPNFGRLTELRLRANGDALNEISQLANTLAREIYVDIPEYFILILEDYHFISDNNEVRTFLDQLIANAPENCQIIISSRGPVELPSLTTAAVRQMVARLNVSHLAFTPAEVKELFDTRLQFSLSDELATRLVTDTDGWIVGILLSAYNLRDGTYGTDVTRLSQQDVFRFLTQEVYERQPPELQSFLLESSTLDDMRPDMLDCLLGLADSRGLLWEVERRNLFISRIDSEKAWYRYHNFFREFLQAKLAAEDKERFSLLHYNAGRLFEEGQQWNEAIAHFMSVRRYQDVLRVIEVAGQEYLNAGKWTTVTKWIEALPADIRMLQPDIRLFHAQSLIHLGDTDEAGRVLTDLLGTVTADEHWLFRAKAYSWRSAAFRLSGYFKEARKDIVQAINILRQNNGPADILGEAYNRLSNIYIHREQGQFKAALKHLRQALKCYTSIFDTNKIAETHNLLGVLYKRLGDLTRANTHFEHARQGYEKAGNSGSLAMVLCNIASIYQRRGEYDLALETLRIGLEKARETGYQRIEAGILINLAEVLRDLDSYEEALATYRKGLNLARQVTETYFVAWAIAGMGETHRLSGNRDKAEVLIREAISLAEEQGQDYEAVIFTIQLGIIAYERRDYQTAMSILEDCYTHLSKIGDKDASAKACLHLAQAFFLAKDYQLAAGWLEKVSALVDELGYDDFLAVEGRNAALLIQYGSSKGIGGDRFTRAMDKIRKRRSLQKRQAASMVSTIVTPANRCDVEVYSLGETKVVVNSHPIAESEWRSSRAKELFFYILCHTDLGQTKEQITTALWPDLSPAKATSNFHINLYRARRAVSPGVFTLEQGRYRLNPDISVWSDVVEFERLLDQVGSLPDDGEDKIAHLKRAIDLYKGQFLVEFYSEWSEELRRQLEGIYLNALSSLEAIMENRREYATAIGLLEKLLDIDSYHDEAYCKLIKLQFAQGDKVAAERTYRRYSKTVSSEMGLSPQLWLENLRRDTSITE